jgi:hypothetical protein
VRFFRSSDPDGPAGRYLQPVKFARDLYGIMLISVSRNVNSSRPSNTR